ncbi:hypothetical protein CR513_13301, partial [Mucuna pruriens]
MVTYDVLSREERMKSRPMERFLKGTGAEPLEEVVIVSKIDLETAKRVNRDLEAELLHRGTIVTIICRPQPKSGTPDRCWPFRQDQLGGRIPISHLRMWTIKV